MAIPQFEILRRALQPRRRVQFFVVLACLLAVAFGLTTWRTARAERQKVALGTCFFAVDASRVLQAQSHYYLQAIADPVFAAVGGRAPLAAGALLPAPAVLRAADSAVAACHCAPRLIARGYFRLDFGPDGRVGALTVERADVDRPSPAAQAQGAREIMAVVPALRVDSIRLKEAVARLVPTLRGGGVVAAAVTNSPSDTDALEAIAVLNPKYGADGQLRAVYGVLVGPGTFALQVIAPVFDRVPLFPSMFAVRGIASDPRPRLRRPRNTELANLAVLDSRWTTLYQTGPMADTASRAPGCVAMALQDPSLALLMLHISPPLDVYSRWIQSSLAESYLPFLGLIAVAMLASVVAAVVGARREAELARLRADFVSSVSHELRMPLAQILMSGETLRFGRIRSQAEHDAEADSIVREALHLTGLVDNALFFSRIEHHNLSVNPRPADLHRLVGDAVNCVWLLAEGSEVTLTNLVPRHLQVSLDPQAFRQVLVNLLDNAIKYGPPGQEILVGTSTSTDDGLMLLWIDDEGPGVPHGDRSSIFEPFIRLDRDRNVGIAGSGLGLAVVRHIVEQHGGRIWVERSTRGSGSRFTIQLSAVAALTHEQAALNGAGAGAS